METEDLRTFVEVADAGGVSPAARRLSVSKSMISRRLARLEMELGVQLLSRTTRGAALTEAGSTFRDYAARIVAEIEVAKDTILPEGELRGRLRIAAPLSFGPSHFAHVIAGLAQRHPALHVQACYTDRFVDLISEGYDCAIRVGTLPDSNLIARRIGPMYAAYVASPAYIEKHGAPQTPDEFITHQALMQGNETWPVMVGDKLIAMKVQGRFKSDNGISLVAAALAGIGIAGLPRALISDHLASGALVEVMPRYPAPEHGIFLVRPPGKHPDRKIRVLTELLLECFGDPAWENRVF